MTANQGFQGGGLGGPSVTVEAESTPQLWAVVDIGCLHCGASSRILHIVADRFGAERLAAQYQDEHDGAPHPETHGFRALPLPPMPPVNFILTVKR